MAAALGQHAARRIDRSLFENDELLKSLGSQLNVDKYNQWQRKERISRPPLLKEKNKDTKMTFKVGTINRTASAHCTPTPVLRGPRVLAKLEEERRKQQEIIDVLELKIKHSKETTDMYIKRSKELIEINLDIVREIENQEHETYAEVKRLLRKYEKFRGSIATLNSNFAKEISEVKHELEETKENIQKKLEALEQQVDNIDRKLKLRQEESQVLRNYKDKEYPVKAMMIAKLHAELESIKNSNQEDQEELEYLILTELGKYDKERIRLANDVTHRITEESIALIHPSLQDMALQNVLMKKEIEFNKKEHKNLIQRNKELEEEVVALSRHPKSNLRLQLFPEFFPTREKCEPDTEMVLDIPKQEWLPV